MLSKKEFSRLFLMETRNQVSAQIQVEEKRITKINQTVMGVVLSQDSGLGAVIYPEQYYNQFEKGEDIENIVAEVLQATLGDEFQKKSRYLEETKQIIGNYDKVKEHIYPIMVNYEQNRSLLRNVPHERYLDLAVIAAYMPRKGYDIKITNSLAYSWEKKGDEILQQARENAASKTPPKVMTLDSLIGDEILTDNVPLYILTNSELKYGAFSITDTKLFSDMEKSMGELYVFPSSIHEVLVTPAKDTAFDPIALEEMVRDINQSHVEPGEVLANHIYRFKEGSMRIMDKGREVTPEQYQQNKNLRFPGLS
ncbi:MAG: DUF5688 family protein [Lachnospiraceae bacterium]|nr:DUF5688 family protein [Lachnospiraceae bacterium]